MTSARTQAYDASIDAQRWPSWRIGPGLTGAGGEIIDVKDQTVIIDAELWQRDEEKCMAHAIAHLDLHMAALSSRQQVANAAVLCAEAACLAAIRMDRPCMP